MPGRPPSQRPLKPLVKAEKDAHRKVKPRQLRDDDFAPEGLLPDGLTLIEKARLLLAVRKAWKRIRNADMKIKGSWKTTAAGFLTLTATLISAAVAVLDENPATTINVEEVLGAITGIGLMFARDNSVSSEDAGAK